MISLFMGESQAFKGGKYEFKGENTLIMGENRALWAKPKIAAKISAYPSARQQPLNKSN
ncbi:hypothetical protein [Bacillus sp. FJAT-27916]|uniref:hypothetical protein n=1 Tax=Bacillus sp. FJAT-27916 TaxID=1679169 RepID=UPI0012E225A0|nr:hypothetical protein [Bacillus sp. FJAT-27916]